MSVKSLLQIIIFLLIVSIIGGIYYIYFYTNPSEKKIINIVDNNLTEDNQIAEAPNIDQEQTIELEVKKKEPLKKKINKSSNLNNLTKEIEYITTNKNGDTFKILAKYGNTNLNDKNVLDLEKVNGFVNLKQGSKLTISSDYAKYNYNNQNSKFYSNVEIKYDNKTITCDNFKLISNKNIAVAYDNVLLIDGNSKMMADTVTIDILTKDVSINSNETIKILKK